MLPLLLALSVSAAPPQPHLDPHGDPLPYGAIARLGTLRLRGAQPGGPFALSPDGKTIAIGEIGAVRLWELATGRHLRLIEMPEGGRRVLQMHYSPNGHMLAAIQNGPDTSQSVRSNVLPTTLTVMDLSTGKVLLSVGQRGESIRLDGFLADGKLALTRDRRLSKRVEDVEVYDLKTGKLTWRAFTPPAPPVCTPRRGHLAVAMGTEIQLRRALRGQLERTFAAGGSVRSVAFSPDGAQLVAGVQVYDRGYVNRLMRWETDTGKPLATWDAIGEGVYAIEYAPDGKHLTALSETGALVLVDAATGKGQVIWAGSEKGPRLTGSAFSPDGKLLVWENGDGLLHLHDIAAGRDRRVWRANRAGQQSLPAFTPDGRTLVTQGPRVRLWDVETGADGDPRPGHDGGVHGISFGPDSRTVLTITDQAYKNLWRLRDSRPLDLGTNDPLFWHHGRLFTSVSHNGMVGVRESHTGRLLHTFHTGGRPTVSVTTPDEHGRPTKSREYRLTFEFSPSGQRAAFVTPDGGLRVWDLGTGKRLLCADERIEANISPNLSISPDDRTLVVHRALAGRLSLWDIDRSRPLPDPVPETIQARRFAFTSDGARLVWTGHDSSLGAYDVRQGKELSRIKHPGVNGIQAIDADAGLLFSFAENRTLAVWSLTGACLREYGRLGEIHNAAVHPFAGQVLGRLWLRGREGKCQIRELMSGRLVAEEFSSDAHAFSPDGRLLAVGSDEVDIREVLTGGLIGQLANGRRGALAELAFSPDSTLLATGSIDMTALVYDWKKACGLSPSKKKLDEAALDRCWQALGERNARIAWQAMSDLILADGLSVATLRARLKPITNEDCRRARELLNDLDSDEYSVRVRARETLRLDSLDWLPLFDEVLASNPSLHLYREVERLIRAAAEKHYSPGMLRRLRAVAVLERIGTAEARRLLQAVAGGDPRMVLTREARAALQRVR